MAAKTCRACGSSFEVARSRGNHRYCATCRQAVRHASRLKATRKYDTQNAKRNLERQKKWRAAKRAARFAPAPCIDCGINIVVRRIAIKISRRKRCEECAEKRRLARLRAYGPTWRTANPDKVKSYAESYRTSGLKKEWGNRRRARSVGSFTAAEWNLLVWIFGNACAYCGKRVASLTADHVVPLIEGGLNVIENILPACRSCNAHKHTSMNWIHKPTGESLRVARLSGAFAIVEVANAI